MYFCLILLKFDHVATLVFKLLIATIKLISSAYSFPRFEDDGIQVIDPNHKLNSPSDIPY